MKPWNVFRIKVIPPERREDEERTDFQPCGVAWPLKGDEPGFNVDLHFALPEGTRLLIKPRKENNGDRGGGR